MVFVDKVVEADVVIEVTEPVELDAEPVVVDATVPVVVEPVAAEADEEDAVASVRESMANWPE